MKTDFRNLYHFKFELNSDLKQMQFSAPPTPLQQDHIMSRILYSSSSQENVTFSIVSFVMYKGEHMPWLIVILLQSDLVQ